MEFLIVLGAVLAFITVAALIEKSRHIDRVCDWLLPDHPRDLDLDRATGDLDRERKDREQPATPPVTGGDRS